MLAMLLVADKLACISPTSFLVNTIVSELVMLPQSQWIKLVLALISSLALLQDLAQHTQQIGEYQAHYCGLLTQTIRSQKAGVTL